MDKSDASKAAYLAVKIPSASFTADMRRGFDTLYDCRWFSRAWGVQKIQLAQPAIVVWGRQEMPWDDIRLSVLWVDHNDSTFDGDHAFFKFWARYANMMVFYTNKEKSLLVVLIICREFHATDPRDKVYGLLRFTNWEDADPLKPDCQKSVGDVFADTAAYIISSGGDLRIFSYVGKHRHYDGNDGYQSCQQASKWGSEGPT